MEDKKGHRKQEVEGVFWAGSGRCVASGLNLGFTSRENVRKVEVFWAPSFHLSSLLP